MKNIYRIMDEVNAEQVSIVSGNAQAQVLEWKSEKKVIQTKAHIPSVLKVSTFYFPGWTAYLDGKKTDIRIEKDSGTMLIDVPEGEHLVALKFEDTSIRLYSKIISIISIFIIIFFTTYHWIQKQLKPNTQRLE